MIDGNPTIEFTEEEVSTLAIPFENALVGKFSGPYPSLIDISEEIKKIGNLKGEVSIGAFDFKYVIIRFQNPTDFQWA